MVETRDQVNWKAVREQMAKEPPPAETWEELRARCAIIGAEVRARRTGGEYGPWHCQ